MQRRSLSLRSATLPQIADYTPQPDAITTPSSAPPVVSASLATASMSASSPPIPAVASPSPPQHLTSASPQPTHPICERAQATASTPAVQPSSAIPQQVPDIAPVTRSISRRSGASWSDIIQKADEDIAGPPFSRPRGRPPSNHNWDAQTGKYVPINVVSHVPACNTAWILAAMQSDLVADHVTPKTYDEAVSGPDAELWKKAIQDELASLKHCAVWKLVVLSALSRKAKAIPTKWVFKIKSDGHGNVVRFKARLVVCGYRQKFGRDYDQTFAPVAHAASIRIILALAVSLRLYLRQFDIKTAFLYKELPESQRVYILPPRGVNVPPQHVLMLLKSVYGLKQASRQWNLHLNKTLHELGFKRSPFDPCVYHLHKNDEYMFLAVVVDDIITASNSLQLINKFENHMAQRYDIKSLGEPKRLVGLNIVRDKDNMTLDQRQFVKDMAAQFKQSDSKPVSTPATLGDVPEGASPMLPPGHKYLSLVGSLLWASLTRPDIAVAVSKACSKSAQPTKADLAKAIRILRYLLHTPNVKLTFTRSQSPTDMIAVYVDAGWANAPKSRSRFGYIVCVHGSPVMWETKVSTMVCLSTAEAEFVAAVHAAKSALWLARMTSDIRNTPVSTVTMLEDNQACIKMITNPVVSARNRHFAMRMWWLRDVVEKRQVRVQYVPTEKQLADILTKVLPGPCFLRLRDMIMSGKDLSPSTNLLRPGGGVSKDNSSTSSTSL